MPIHDWAVVDVNLFQDFHQTWTVAICNALNRGLLPRRFSALLERHGPPITKDVTSRDSRPTQEILAALGNRITIQKPLGHVVSVIEVISPGNKGSRHALGSFMEKTADFLRRGIHLLVIDLFPPSKRDPHGIYKAIWDEIEERPFELPPDKPLTLATYVADVPKAAYVEPVGVGDVLPDMPAFLEPDCYVPVPLEATYQAAWATCPADMREAVEQGLPPSDDQGE